MESWHATRRVGCDEPRQVKCNIRIHYEMWVSWASSPQRVVKIVLFGIRPDLIACIYKERSRAVGKVARVDFLFRILRVLPVTRVQQEENIVMFDGQSDVDIAGLHVNETFNISAQVAQRQMFNKSRMDTKQLEVAKVATHEKLFREFQRFSLFKSDGERSIVARKYEIAWRRDANAIRRYWSWCEPGQRCNRMDNFRRSSRWQGRSCTQPRRFQSSSKSDTWCESSLSNSRHSS